MLVLISIYAISQKLVHSLFHAHYGSTSQCDTLSYGLMVEMLIIKLPTLRGLKKMLESLQSSVVQTPRMARLFYMGMDPSRSTTLQFLACCLTIFTYLLFYNI